MFEWLFSQYDEVPTYIVAIELVGILFALLSVWFSLNVKIWVFPTGIISTFIFVYLLWWYGLFGDMIINAYYFIMSIWGWMLWSRKNENGSEKEITSVNKTDIPKGLLLFVGSFVFIMLIYWVFGTLQNETAWIDALTTAFFFVGMWLLAYKKIENWLMLLVGNIITVPLYLYKGLVFSSLLYLVYIGFSIAGYLAWKKILHKSTNTSIG